jgi:hypothetical protein
LSAKIARHVEGGQLLMLRIPLPVVTSASQYMNGGWSWSYRSNGSVFGNQEGCVHYVNTGN